VSAALARQLFEMGIRDERVLWAVGQVPRRLFVPPALRDQAEADRPLPIGHGQTISQPYIVAFMTELLALLGREKVLEIGTGSGYQTAVLALLAAKVDSVEIVPELSARAAELLLATLALPNVHLRVADGAGGWPEEAPFDRILVTAAPGTLPPALVDQLATGGRMVVPVGEEEGVQVLKTVEKGPDGRVTARDIIPVRFVPLRTGTPLLS
jgi:protein-L-isoaspartate(D-aspartate) O-methyltransferase